MFLTNQNEFFVPLLLKMHSVPRKKLNLFDSEKEFRVHFDVLLFSKGEFEFPLGMILVMHEE